MASSAGAAVGAVGTTIALATMGTIASAGVLAPVLGSVVGGAVGLAIERNRSARRSVNHREEE
ncbi:MAG: hypothetical protein JOZ78_02670 [Chroococcidiopsidaceae cyanobacterium CP_BM_ER_R8_30]|nr:hypothetical protein [Chroococcidiopsidaceae cyanobacterium CP_BM_ER_R8_30]